MLNSHYSKCKILRNRKFVYQGPNGRRIGRGVNQTVLTGLDCMQNEKGYQKIKAIFIMETLWTSQDHLDCVRFFCSTIEELNFDESKFDGDR